MKKYSFFRSLVSSSIYSRVSPRRSRDRCLVTIPSCRQARRGVTKLEEELRAGFTLVELMVVTMIILLISTIGVVSFNVANRSARDSKRQASLEQIRSALEIYRNDCGSYPATVPFGGTLTGQVSCAGGSNTYMENVPQDPQYPSQQYQYDGSGNSYVLCAQLESTPLNNPCASRNCTAVCKSGVSCNYRVCNP